MNIENKKKEWEENLNKLYLFSDSLSKEIKTLLEIIVYTTFGEKIGRLYKIINNNDLFIKLLCEFGDCDIKLPSKDEFTDCVLTAMIYYYNQVLHYDWNKIQEILPYEHDIALRYKRKISNINGKMKRLLNKLNDNENVQEKDIFEV